MLEDLHTVLYSVRLLILSLGALGLHGYIMVCYGILWYIIVYYRILWYIIEYCI